MFTYVDEDIKLNSTVFHWPHHIKTVFEVSQDRISKRRKEAEDETRRMVAAFEETLSDYQREVDSFRKKEVREGGFWDKGNVNHSLDSDCTSLCGIWPAMT